MDMPYVIGAVSLFLFAGLICAGGFIYYKVSRAENSDKEYWRGQGASPKELHHVHRPKAAV